MRTVVVPRHPGVLSTLGLLGTEVRNDYARTHLEKPPDYDLGAVAAVYAELEGQRRRGSPPRASRRPDSGSPVWPTSATATRLRAHGPVARA